MYLSHADIHSVQKSSLEHWHLVSRGCLNFMDDCISLSTGLAKRLLDESVGQIRTLKNEESAAQWVEQIGNIGYPLLKEHIPVFISEAVHTSAFHMEQFWSTTESRVSDANGLASHFFERGLEYSPWETFWLIDATRAAVDESLATANRISDAAIAATESIDEEIQSRIAPPASQSGKRIVVAV